MVGVVELHRRDDSVDRDDYVMEVVGLQVSLLFLDFD